MRPILAFALLVAPLLSGMPSSSSGLSCGKYRRYFGFHHVEPKPPGVFASPPVSRCEDCGGGSWTSVNARHSAC